MIIKAIFFILFGVGFQDERYEKKIYFEPTGYFFQKTGLIHRNPKIYCYGYPGKKILFNLYYAGEMSKEELTELVKRLLLEKELGQ